MYIGAESGSPFRNREFGDDELGFFAVIRNRVVINREVTIAHESIALTVEEYRNHLGTGERGAVAFVRFSVAELGILSYCSFNHELAFFLYWSRSRIDFYSTAGKYSGKCK